MATLALLSDNSQFSWDEKWEISEYFINSQGIAQSTKSYWLDVSEEHVDFHSCALPAYARVRAPLQELDKAQQRKLYGH